MNKTIYFVNKKKKFQVAEFKSNRANDKVCENYFKEAIEKCVKSWSDYFDNELMNEIYRNE